jgi:hypothetical protein
MGRSQAFFLWQDKECRISFQNPVEKKVVSRLAYTPCRVLSCASRFQKFRTAFFFASGVAAEKLQRTST